MLVVAYARAFAIVQLESPNDSSDMTNVCLCKNGKMVIRIRCSKCMANVVVMAIYAFDTIFSWDCHWNMDVWELNECIQWNSARVHMVQFELTGCVLNACRSSNAKCLIRFTGCICAHGMTVLRRYKCRTSVRFGSSYSRCTQYLMSLVANGSFDVIYVS